MPRLKWGRETETQWSQNVGEVGDKKGRSWSLFCPWKHRTLNYGEAMEWHLDFSFVRLAMLVSIYPLISPCSLSAHQWTGTVLGAWDRYISEQTKMLALPEFTF